jgi:hypothetical protein
MALAHFLALLLLCSGVSFASGVSMENRLPFDLSLFTDSLLSHRFALGTHCINF